MKDEEAPRRKSRSKTGAELGIRRGPGQPRKAPEERLCRFPTLRAPRRVVAWYAELGGGRRRQEVARAALKALTLLDAEEFSRLEASVAANGDRLAGTIAAAIIVSLK